MLITGRGMVRGEGGERRGRVVTCPHLMRAMPSAGLGTANLSLATGTRRHRSVGVIRIALAPYVTASSFRVRELCGRHAHA